MLSALPLSLVAAALLQRPSSVGVLFEHGVATAGLSVILAAVGLALDWAGDAQRRRAFGFVSLAIALALVVHGLVGDTPFVTTVDLLVVAPALLPALMAWGSWSPRIWRQRPRVVGLLVAVIVLGVAMAAGLGLLGALGTMR